MKKILGLAALVFSTTALLASCGGGGGGDDYKRRPDGLIDFSDQGFDEKYYPDLNTIKEKPVSGQVDIAIVFDGRDPGYKEAAKEYMRIRKNSVNVKINAQYTAETYTDALNSNLEMQTPTWDIVQGNMSPKANTTTCVPIKSKMSATNPFAGEGTKWKDVLEPKAYFNRQGTMDNVYMINSESLQTAWFINEPALVAAKTKGYTGPDSPTTWDELLDLCKYMKDAGYPNPLGISLDKNSIGSEQFTWLLRVYGDYFYRNLYKELADSGSYTYNPEDVDFDADKNWKIHDNMVYTLVIDKDEEVCEPSELTYSGPYSSRFKEFLTQLIRMKDYINPEFASSTSFGDLRNKFATQADGNNSPQIFLDYLGEAFLYKQNNLDFDFFDYPVMRPSKGSGVEIEENTAVRDVGGNGGYLSVVKKTGMEDATWDFMQFFLSPYGQSVYYAGLSKSTITPKGITTVKNAIIPASWKELFNSDKVKFNGLADNNPFLTYLLRNFASMTETTKIAPKYYSDLINGDMSIDDFAKGWHEAIVNKDWAEYVKAKGYGSECWKNPYGEHGKNPS